MLDPDKTPFLFSVGTNLSYSIAHDYYYNVQYVWCSTHFDSVDQAPTSNPATIARKYIDEALKGDRHSPSIDLYLHTTSSSFCWKPLLASTRNG